MVLRNAGIAALIAAAAASAAPAAAQEGGNDVRCLLLSNYFAKAATDPRSKEMAALGRFYYLGRIAGRITGNALKAALEKESAAVQPAAAGDAMKACLERVDRDNRALAAVGGQIKPPAEAEPKAGPKAPSK